MQDGTLALQNAQFLVASDFLFRTSRIRIDSFFPLRVAFVLSEVNYETWISVAASDSIDGVKRNNGGAYGKRSLATESSLKFEWQQSGACLGASDQHHVYQGEL